MISLLRIRIGFVAVCMIGYLSYSVQTSAQMVPHDGQHDFDFEIGTWKTHLRRLVHPLTGSTTWVEYDGTTVVRKVWNGRANLIELEADGSAGHFEGLNLRLYNPASHQWSLNFASSSGGTMSQTYDRRVQEWSRRILRPGNAEWPRHLRSLCHFGPHSQFLPL